MLIQIITKLRQKKQKQKVIQTTGGKRNSFEKQLGFQKQRLQNGWKSELNW